MTSGNGITDNETNDDLKRKFMGVYSSDSIAKYLNVYDIIKERRASYPFAIFNTDRKSKPGTHW